MKQYLLICIFALHSIFMLSQTSTEETLATIKNEAQAKQFIKDKHTFDSKVFTFNQEKHKSLLAKALFELEKGQVKVEKNQYEKTLYKILDKTKNSYYRVSYICLDGSIYSLQSIKELRKTLLLKYDNNVPFSELANQYSMDNNANKGGDTGWFTLGNMNPDFESAITNGQHALNTIYTVDVPSKNWYYLVLQTHEPKEITEIEVLKIVEPIE